MMVAHEGIKRAAEKVGVHKFTREDVLNEIMDIKGFNPPAGLSGPLDFSDKNPTTIGATTACIAAFGHITGGTRSCTGSCPSADI